MDLTAVGICAALDHASFSEGEQLAAIAPLSVIRAVTDAGGLPLVLAPDDELAQAPDPLIDRVEALLLIGGAPVDPGSYGAPAENEAGKTWPERDRYELGLVHRALERDMPVLGLGRGMLMLNVALGGTLDGAGTHHDGSERELRLEPGSLAARTAGAERLTVACAHRHAPGQLGEGLVATGHSEGDGTIEAIESAAHRFALGLGWHSHEGPATTALVRAAKAGVAAG